ncbi:MAG: hypothetical protein V3V28_01320 [Polaribacter sp.]|uniref:hypothetical protein n=1 Tax=Polaribacter sp. TaxID=1920175 RepID=UPI002F35EA31
MKTIKILTILFITVFSNCSQAQRLNNLTETEYNNIKINNINWQTISDTKGNATEIRNLLGDGLMNTQGAEPSLHIEFWNDSKGIYLYFEENNPNIVNDYILHDFTISNNQSSITVKGKIITIGDDISLLGNEQINVSGTDISFSTNYTDDILMIKFDSRSKEITSIEYTSFN